MCDMPILHVACLFFPKGPCTKIVYTWALKYSLYRYIGPKVYTIWVHGPLGFVGALTCGLT